MNYTQIYHLPQWAETDRVLMTDFNAAMAGIEAGLTEAQATANDTQAPVAAAQTAADAAQSTAEAAQQTADTALAKANAAWSATNPFFVTRTYVGTGTNTARTVDVGFRPSLVIMTSDSNMSFFSVYPCTRAGSTSGIEWTSTGFRAGGGDITSNFNESGVRYHYLAVR